MIRLKKLREARHFSQQRLAMEFNITQAAISKYEIGLSEPSIDMLIKMADYFNVSVDYIIGASDNPIRISNSDIKEDEAVILNNYKRLNPTQKEKAQAYIQGMLQK